TALIQDITGLLAEPRPGAARLTEKDLATLWAKLGGEDAREAHQAIVRLVTSPEDAAGMLAAKLQPAAPPPAGLIDRLLADLDAKRFKVREEARAKLLHLGGLAEPALRRLLGRQPPVEVHRRAQNLLDRIQPGRLSGEGVRSLRAVE